MHMHLYMHKSKAETPPSCSLNVVIARVAPACKLLEVQPVQQEADFVMGLHRHRQGKAHTTLLGHSTPVEPNPKQQPPAPLPKGRERRLCSRADDAAAGQSGRGHCVVWLHAPDWAQ